MGKSNSNRQQEVAALGDLPRFELAAMWLKTHGCQPPKGVKRNLLERSAAWHLQAKRLGGFSAETRRMLRSAIEAADRKIASRSGKHRSRKADHNLSGETDHSLVAEANSGTAVSVSGASGTLASSSGEPDRKRREVQPGARLLREWNGRNHVVDVIEGGYVFEAKVYQSLSAIARIITGAHWSGPRFFGLAKR